MRTFAVGDIHGGFRALKQLMLKITPNPEDQFIFLGDYVDGWSESAQVIEYLIEFSTKYNCVFIKGNHDAWCEQWLLDDSKPRPWLIHGGYETIESYKGFSAEQKQLHLDFFNQMPMYYVDANKRLFVHAGFTSLHGVEKETYNTTFYTDRTLWEMALIMDKRIEKHSELYPNRLKHYNEIFIGHTPTLRFSHDVPMNAINVWNVDTGAAFTGRLSAIDIDTKDIFQTDNLPKLYPNELGRNK